MAKACLRDDAVGVLDRQVLQYAVVAVDVDDGEAERVRLLAELLASLRVFDPRALAALAAEGDEAGVDADLLAVGAVLDEKDAAFAVVGRQGVERGLDGFELARTIGGDDQVGCNGQKRGRSEGDGCEHERSQGQQTRKDHGVGADEDKTLRRGGEVTGGRAKVTKIQPVADPRKSPGPCGPGLERVVSPRGMLGEESKFLLESDLF